MTQFKALVVGGGSKFGEALADLMSNDYEVHVVTGSDTVADRVIKVVWHSCTLDDVIPKIDRDYDLIIFNQNSGGGPNDHAFDLYTKPIEHWNQANFTDMQLPYYIVRNMKLKEDTKICWMLTSAAVDIRLRKGIPQYGGYAGLKANNYHLMYSFAHKCISNFYGLMPRNHYEEKDVDLFALKMYSVICNLKPEHSGGIIDEYGEIYGV